MWFAKCAPLALLAALGAEPESLSLGYRKKVYKTIPDRLLVCEMVYKDAIKAKVDPLLALALAFHENKFTYTVSPQGAVGPLQVIMKYIPEQLKERPIEAGLWALKKRMRENKDLCDALAKYNRGAKGACDDPKSGGHAKRIIAMWKSLQSLAPHPTAPTERVTPRLLSPGLSGWTSPRTSQRTTPCGM